MVEDERYRIDVLQQISAAQAALDKVALALVDATPATASSGPTPKIRRSPCEELISALARLVGRR